MCESDRSSAQVLIHGQTKRRQALLEDIEMFDLAINCFNRAMMADASRRKVGDDGWDMFQLRKQYSSSTWHGPTPITLATATATTSTGLFCLALCYRAAFHYYPF